MCHTGLSCIVCEGQVSKICIFHRIAILYVYINVMKIRREISVNTQVNRMKLLLSFLFIFRSVGINSYENSKSKEF